MTLPRGAAALLLGLPGTLVAQNVAEVQVAPPSITVKVGERSGLLATAFDRVGNVIPTVRVFWSSNNIQIARVDNNGTVTGVANGVAIIEARVGSRKGTAAVQVVGGTGPPPPPPNGGQQVTQTPPGTPPSDGSLAGQPPGTGVATVLRLEPPTIYLLPSENVRAAPLALQWTSSAPSVARVSLTGVLTAVAPGKATVSVSGLLQAKSIDVVVHRPVELLAVRPKWQDEVLVPIQGTVKFEAQALAADRTPVADAPLQWSLADTSLASFDAASGVLAGRKAGKTQLVVKGPGQGLIVTWTVRVLAASVRLSAARLGLPLNRRYTLKGNYVDSAGAVIGLATALTWASDNPPVVAVADDRTITAPSHR